MWERRALMSVTKRDRSVIALAMGLGADVEDAAEGAKMAGGGALGWTVPVSNPDIAAETEACKIAGSEYQIDRI